jgi:aminoglycoside 6-adenylyltransferase
MTDDLLAAVEAWGRQRADVRAALLVGSRARVDVPADRWSDYDVVLMVDDPAQYADDAGWLTAFGRPLLTFVEPTAVGGFVERRVLYDTGQDVDFALIPTMDVAQFAAEPAAAAVLWRGYRVLLDKVGLAPALGSGPRVPVVPGPPGAAEFVQLTHDFWYHAIWAAKKLRRGEVFIAKQACDGYLKGLTVRLLAWHAKAADPEVDTWHGGRFLERWADRPALAELRQAYAGYDAEDVARALGATVDLFERVERACAALLGLPLTVAHQEVRARLRAVLDDRDRPA